MMPNITFSDGLMKMVTTQPTWRIADDDRVGQRRPTVRRVVAGDAQPGRDHRDAHDHVAGDHHAVVEVLALVDRLERRRQPEGEHEYSEHLHEGRDAEEHVVGVVSRGEPRVVDPGEADREHRDEKPRKAGPNARARAGAPPGRRPG